MYSLATGACLHSRRWHEEAVSSLATRAGDGGETLVASAGRDGLVKLYTVAGDGLRCVFVSENLTSATPDTSIHFRPIYCVQLLGERD